jgi:chemotaxis protein methyltransferase CheR
LQLDSFKEYCELLKEDGTDEFTHFVNALTTNVTSFFRESHHFDFLQQTVIPDLVKKHGHQARPRLRIWSAGCSSGQEPYSIAMTLKESAIDLNRWDAKVLATDLDSTVLATAREGVYEINHLKDELPQRCKRWVNVVKKQNKEYVIVDPKIKELITFKQLNLMDDWPMNGPFDVIFCRNVQIYFTKTTQKMLINAFADFLNKGGYLIVGHSESLIGLTDLFKSVGKTIHQKTTR